MAGCRLPRRARRWLRDHSLSNPQTQFAEQEANPMATVNLEEAQDYLKFAAILKNLPKRLFSLLYDAEADVLYIDFYNPPKSASDSELTEEDIVVRYGDDDDIVGLTVLNASKPRELA
jgi:uncharacterized protein YuzE